MNEPDNFNELNEWVAKNLFGYNFHQGQWYDKDGNIVNPLPDFLEHNHHRLMAGIQQYGRRHISKLYDEHITSVSFDEWKTKGEHRKLGVAIALAAKASLEATEPAQKQLFPQ